MNCLNPKYGHSAQCPFTYFLCFQTSFLFPEVSKLHRTGNLTSVSEFFLLGLSDDPELQPLLCILFLSMYLVTVLGNLLIILAVTSDPHLHTCLATRDTTVNKTKIPSLTELQSLQLL